METIIVICLLIVIILLLKDKVVIYKPVRGQQKQEKKMPRLPDIMGLPRPVERHAMPMKAVKRQLEEPDGIPDNFETETEESGFDIEIPQEELDEVFGDVPNLNEEEEEWHSYGAPNGEDGFATGVTFEELTTVGTLLQQEVLEPALQEQAVDIVYRIQGTDLFSLLESSIGNASQKIARLLDQRIAPKTDSGSSTLRNGGLEDFDIGEFV